MKSGYADTAEIRKIARALFLVFKSARTPFGEDVAGAERILRHFGEMPGDGDEIDLGLWAERVGADGTRHPFAGNIRDFGNSSFDRHARQIACSLVRVCECTPKFPFSDGADARKLLAFMGIDVDREGDVDLSAIADRLGAAPLPVDEADEAEGPSP